MYIYIYWVNPHMFGGQAPSCRVAENVTMNVPPPSVSVGAPTPPLAAPPPTASAPRPSAPPPSPPAARGSTESSGAQSEHAPSNGTSTSRT